MVTEDVTEIRRPLVVVTTALLPFTFLPHELGLKDFPIATLSLALVLIVMFRYHAFQGHWSGPEMSLWWLAAAVTIRQLLSPLEGSAVLWDLIFTQVGGILAAIILFRLGRRPELRPSFILGLRFALALMLLFEGYQLIVGLPALEGAGYVYPDFPYYTATGTYRPFGTFRTPVTFGAYLAMVGIAVTLTTKGLPKYLFLLATIGGLAATETRSAWIAFALAGGIVLLSTAGVVRRRSVLALIVGGYALLVVSLVNPGLFEPMWSRLATVSDPTYSSNSTRIILWGYAIRAGITRPIEGFGGAGFTSVLPPSLAQTFSHPHNNYLQIFFAYGLMGLIPFLVFLITVAYALRKRNFTTADMSVRMVGIAVLTTFAVTSLFESMWSTFSVFVTLGLLLGLGMPATVSDSRYPRISRLGGKVANPRAKLRGGGVVEKPQSS